MFKTNKSPVIQENLLLLDDRIIQAVKEYADLLIDLKMQ